MGRPWRLIPFCRGAGRDQMAIDTWLLRDYVPQTGRPVLRFYDWQPAAISLGALQRTIPDHWRSLRWQERSLDLVKRPSGGRAVLHQGGLTYAVVLPKPGGDRADQYRWICDFLIQGWAHLGVELTYGQGGRGYIHNASCFNTATVADLVTLQGDKLIGSAQTVTRSTLLHHGTMILQGDRRLYTEVFHQDPPWQRDLLDLAGYPSLEQILTTLISAAQTHFSAQFIPEPLTPEEQMAMPKAHYLNV